MSCNEWAARGAASCGQASCLPKQMCVLEIYPHDFSVSSGISPSASVTQSLSFSCHHRLTATRSGASVL
jgi:hypothetical protein